MNYPVEFTTAVLISSTALFGLSGLFLTNKTIKRFRLFRWAFLISNLFGVAVILTSILWFAIGYELLLSIDMYLFMGQILMFAPLAGAFAAPNKDEKK